MRRFASYALALGLGLFATVHAFADDTAASGSAAADAAAAEQKEGFVTIFGGRTLDGWKINENKDTWKLEDGALVAHGQRSHIFYVGDEKPFKDFILKVDVMTGNNSNGGIYFHTKYQDSGWPKYGFEVQVNNSYNSDPRKTASLYAVKDTNTAAAKDDEWFTETIIVKGDKVTTQVNGKTIIEYTEPAGTVAGKDFTRKLDSGTFALQAHDPNSVVKYKNIRVKRLD